MQPFIIRQPSATAAAAVDVDGSQVRWNRWRRRRRRRGKLFPPISLPQSFFHNCLFTLGASEWEREWNWWFLSFSLNPFFPKCSANRVRKQPKRAGLECERHYGVRRNGIIAQHPIRTSAYLPPPSSCGLIVFMFRSPLWIRDVH